MGMMNDRHNLLTVSLSNDLFSPCASNTGPNLNLDTLSSLFTRLILQNHFTRLAGDILGNHNGGALWGCNLPASSSSQSLCSSCHPHSHSQSCGGAATNMACMCHTCPAATRPYMGTNNVFVIPTAHMQQQPVGVSSGGLGNLNLNNNNLNMFLSGLGLALGATNSGCGAGVNSPAAGFSLPAFGAGFGGQVSQAGPSFSCNRCNFQMM